MNLDPIVSIAGFSEPFASLAHLIGAAIVLWRGIPLVRRAKDVRERLGLGAFVIGTILMFALSGTYHLLDPHASARVVLQRLDHAAIWVMIAGSFSAVHAIAFRGVWRWGFLALVWAIAIAGLVLKTVFFADFPDAVGLALYLILGWMGLATIVQTWRHTRWKVARLLFFSGVAYSAGAIYDFVPGPTLVPGVLRAHELFHLAVILGVALHWRFVGRLLAASATTVLPTRGPQRLRSHRSTRVIPRFA